MNPVPYDFFVQLHLTERCNLRCRHCYQAEATPEMGREEICRAIDNLSAGIEGWAIDHELDISPSLDLTGGEPFLRRDLFEIIDYAREAGFSVCLMSNGTLIDRALARRLREARVHDVQISIDGLEGAHDSWRGEGAFQRAVEGIRNLAAEGVEVNINVTACRMNMYQTGGLVRFAEETGASAIAFSRLVPTGRGKGLAGEIMTREEVARFYQELREYKGSRGVAVTSRDPLAAVADIELEVPDADFPVGGCAAGVFGITINADGVVMPCRRMDLSIGNIRDVSFRELWADSPVLWALRTREDYHGGCESCRYWAVCRGCRAIALASARASGREDYLGPDPQCVHWAPA